MRICIEWKVAESSTVLQLQFYDERTQTLAKRWETKCRHHMKTMRIRKTKEARRIFKHNWNLWPLQLTSPCTPTSMKRDKECIHKAVTAPKSTCIYHYGTFCLCEIHEFWSCCRSRLESRTRDPYYYAEK